MTSISQWRNWFAVHLGVTHKRKVQVYNELLESVSVRDASYWLQVLFSAGIATLGLVLNSPGVIIGAMLISPLMGPILANGLAFAVGDLVLALRANFCLILSCVVAGAFATLLISILPYKELTPEIEARIDPTVLDLGIALFSGALGAIATCKDSKGVVNAIPGVAIAVALMPPLCVVGYGIGIAMSLASPQGLIYARGGGLLLITNLTAISFVAMVVFLILNMATSEVREEANQLHQLDVESTWVEGFLTRFPAVNNWPVIGSMRNRLLVIAVPILVLLIPLGQAFGRLQRDFVQSQRQTEIEQTVKRLWNENFGQTANGTLRSSIDTFSSQEERDNLTLNMRIFTQKRYSEAEQKAFVQRFSDRSNIDKPVKLELIQVLTASSELITKLTDETEQQPQQTEQPPSIAQLRTDWQRTLDRALTDLDLPTPADLLGYEWLTRNNQSFVLTLVYLSDRELGADGQTVLGQLVQDRLAVEDIQVTFQQIKPDQDALTFTPAQIELTDAQNRQLDRVGELLQRYPETVQLQLVTSANPQELADPLAGLDIVVPNQQRLQIIQDYLTQEWQVSPNLITVIQGQDLETPPASQVRLVLRAVAVGGVSEARPVPAPVSNPLSIPENTN